MAQLEPNKWQGVDVISLLMGGNKSKLELAGKGLEQLANFMKDVNELRKLINEGVDKAALALKNDIEKLLKLNPLKAVLEAFVQELRDAVTDLKGTGIYFLDLNAVVPPMWSYGFTFEEARIDAQISVIRGEIVELENRLQRTEETEQLIEQKNNQIGVLQDRKNNVRRNNYGGTAKYAQTFNDSLVDPLDYSRPILSGDAEIAAMFIMFGSSSLGEFFKAWDAFNSLIKSFKIVPTDGYLPLQDLTVKYTSTDVYDFKYVQLRTYLDRAYKEYEKQKERDKLDITAQFLGGLIVRNNESNEIEATIPIHATIDQINKAKNGTPLSSSIPESEIQDRANESKIPLYIFGGKKSDKYFELRDIMCVLNKRYVEELELDIDNFYYDRGTISYVPGGKIFNFLRRKDVEIYDDTAPDSAEGNVYLYWKYPKQSAIVTKIFRGVFRTWENAYILKKRITADNPFDDLQSVLLTGVPPEGNSDLEIITVSNWMGIRKSYFDKVENIEIAAGQEILGYKYAVAGGYTVTERFVLKTIFGAGVGTFHYPLYTVLHNPDAPESKEIIDKRTAERKAILEKLARDGGETALEIRNQLIKQHSIKGQPPENIPVRQVQFSNVASMDFPTDYDLTQSVPPDWKRFPHLTMLFPKLFQILDDIVEFIDTLVNYVKDAFDFIDELADALKLEADYYLKKILQIVKALSDIIKALSDLAFGAYIMVVKIPSGAGGLEELKKILAMSLMGNLEDVTWSDNPEAYLKFQSGPPPFGRDDYVGGYCLMGGAADFIVELLEALVQGDLDPDFIQEFLDRFDSDNDAVKSIPDTFSEDYDKMADASDQKKQELEDAINAAGGENASEEDVAAAYESVNPSLTIDVPDKDEESAKQIAYLSGAIDALNSGDTPSLAGFLANSMDCSYGYSDAGIAGDSLKNYDGSAITKPSLLAFLTALKNCSRSRMLYAAEMLRLTGDRLPNDLTLFQNDEDATAWNNFFLLLAQAIAEQLAAVPVNESLRNVFVSVDPLDNITDRSVDLEEDSYQVGLNIAVYDPWDPRTLNSLVYNDQPEVLVANSLMDIELYRIYEWEGLVANTQWEVELYDEANFG